MKKRTLPLLILALLACAFLLSGCATRVVNAITNERSLGTVVEDTGIEASVKTKLVSEKALNIRDVNVYCFLGHVYLVGEAEGEFAQKAEELAAQVNGVKEVTGHFFPLGTTTTDDIALEAKINKEMLFAEKISSGKIYVDVWGGEAVLLGVLDNQVNINRAIALTKAVPGVKSVTSFLTLIK